MNRATKFRLGATLLLAGVVAAIIAARPAGSRSRHALPQSASSPLAAGRGSVVSTPARSWPNQISHVTPPPNPSRRIGENRLQWERQIQPVLDGAPEDSAKAQVLLSILPGLPEEALGVVAETATTYLRDPDYSSVALPVLLDPRTHGAVLSALFTDLMERPDAIALPTLLAVASTPEHPFAEHARQNLELLLGEDFRSEWAAWDSAIQRHLAGDAPAPNGPAK